MKVNRRSGNCLKPVSSGFMVVLGIALLCSHQSVVDFMYNGIFILKPNNYFYKEWMDPTIPITIDFYYFNWTNPEDLMNTSVKPRFEEVGPLIFHQEVHRRNITVHDNDTITYKNLKTFYLHEDESAASFEDNVTTLNIVPLVASEKARNWNFFLRKGLAVALYDTPYHITKTAREWLFDGFEDTLLKTAGYLPFLDDVPNMDKFAWFYQRNHSVDYEGVYNIGSGMGNTTVGKTYNWNYRNKTDYSGHCSKLQANAEIYPQNIQKDKIELFFPDFCRKIILDYNGSTVWNGIEAYKFVAGVNFLDNGKYHPENTCLCNRRCLKYGVIDYSKCKFGIPAYMSFPHFTQADPKYRNDIEGMNPDNDKHKLEIMLNPRTGVVLKMDMSIQLNVLLEPNPSVSKYSNVPEVMFPVFWFRLNIRLDSKQIVLLNVVLRLPLIFQIISLILIILGTVLHIHYLYEFFTGKKKKKNQVNDYHSENLSLMQKDLCETA